MHKLNMPYMMSLSRPNIQPDLSSLARRGKSLATFKGAFRSSSSVRPAGPGWTGGWRAMGDGGRGGVEHLILCLDRCGQAFIVTGILLGFAASALFGLSALHLQGTGTDHAA